MQRFVDERFKSLINKYGRESGKKKIPNSSESKHLVNLKHSNEKSHTKLVNRKRNSLIKIFIEINNFKYTLSLSVTIR